MILVRNNEDIQMFVKIKQFQGIEITFGLFNFCIDNGSEISFVTVRQWCKTAEPHLFVFDKGFAKIVAPLLGYEQNAV